jgi:hypothetical protein
LEHYFSQVRFILSLHFQHITLCADTCRAEDETVSEETSTPKVDEDIGKHADASKTDDEVVQK